MKLKFQIKTLYVVGPDIVTPEGYRSRQVPVVKCGIVTYPRGVLSMHWTPIIKKIGQVGQNMKLEFEFTLDRYVIWLCMSCGGSTVGSIHDKRDKCKYGCSSGFQHKFIFKKIG